MEGKAPKWTNINIVDDKIELLDAREYLGLFSDEMDDKLKEKHGKDSSVLSIGIAGEKKVLLAAITNDKNRAAGTIYYFDLLNQKFETIPVIPAISQR